jgi:hypothetical protein
MRTLNNNSRKRLVPLPAAATAAVGAADPVPAPAPAPAFMIARPTSFFTLLAVVKSYHGAMQLCNSQGVALSLSFCRV